MPAPVQIHFRDDLNNWDKIVWKDGHMYRSDVPGGMIQWMVNEQNFPREDSPEKRTYRSLYYTCPCGCGILGHLPIVTPEGYKDGWAWDGNLTHPSTTPSIQMLTACRWHGYLTKGWFTTC